MNARLAFRCGCALASALLIRLAFPPFDLGWLMLVAWLPFLWVVRRSSFRAAAAYGALHGFVLGVAAHHWVVPALVRHGQLPSWQACLALGAIALVCALRSAAVGAAVALSVGRGVPLWLSFPIFASCAELLVPGFFPWTNALAVHALPLWGQAAMWGGASLVSAWLSLTNALLTEAAARLASTRSVRAALGPLACAVAVVLGASGFGGWALARQAERAPVAPKLRLAIAHATSSGQSQDDLVPELRALTIAHQMRAGESDLVLWPEGVSMRPVSPAAVASEARRYWLRDRSEPLGAPVIQSPLLLGVSLDDAGGLRNSALLIERGGLVAGEYAKRHLVPVGETGLLPRQLSDGVLGEGVTRYRPGSSQQVLRVRDHALAVSICFEDILSEAVRSEVDRSDAELLVNLTSDRWFAGTSAVDFHFALAKLRAVEHGKYLVRATRDGVSAVVDAAGRVVVSESGGSSRIVATEVPLLAGQTSYARWASWQRAGWLAVGLALLLALKRRAPIDTRTG
jgi:apolipoprotein N-acyltransferase